METVTMSYEELDRVSVMERVIEKRLTQREAARMLGLTRRQVRRLRRVYVRDGAVGLASKRRGGPSNRRLPSELRGEALATVRSRYEGFGPTLAHEKLTELHGLQLSVETLRHWMIDDGLWIPRACREPRIQQPRRRRPCRGELIQIDGSDHEWFEQRAPRCTLLVFVDDATSELMELLFCESESAFSYFAALRSYLEQHGKPVALYSDKASVFRSNKNEPEGGAGVTQFSRALSSLNIDIICANTPAAKGRVERIHLTLQDLALPGFGWASNGAEIGASRRGAVGGRGDEVGDMLVGWLHDIDCPALRPVDRPGTALAGVPSRGFAFGSRGSDLRGSSGSSSAPLSGV